jgi:Transposase
MSKSPIAIIGIDLGKNSFHVIGFDGRGAIVLRQKRSRHQLESSLANMAPCLIGMEACAGAHHLGRKIEAMGHQARLMPAQYVKPYLKGHKNDYRDAEAIAEAVQRPTMRFVPLKSPGATRPSSASPGPQSARHPADCGYRSNSRFPSGARGPRSARSDCASIRLTGLAGETHRCSLAARIAPH